jgi:sporulation protein YlmC with PRC-barrel domain
MVDLKKAMVISMILPGKGFFFRMEQEISWAAVKKISDDLVLLEYEPSKEEKKGNYLGLSKKGN